MKSVSIAEYPLDERDTTHNFAEFDWNAVHPLLAAEQLNADALAAYPVFSNRW